MVIMAEVSTIPLKKLSRGNLGALFV
jgi:hypothetical protein